MTWPIRAHSRTAPIVPQGQNMNSRGLPPVCTHLYSHLTVLRSENQGSCLKMRPAKSSSWFCRIDEAQVHPNNPSGNVGRAKGGACRRMFVDFGHPDRRRRLTRWRKRDSRQPVLECSIELLFKGQFALRNMGGAANKLPRQANARTMPFRRPWYHDNDVSIHYG